jgi:hypothetical protein
MAIRYIPEKNSPGLLRAGAFLLRANTSFLFNADLPAVGQP